MNKIIDINIKGFRGIKSLHLGELGRINVLLGNNNCGKSSALEATAILLGAANPELPFTMNMARHYKRIDNDSISLFFHNLDASSEIAVAAEFENQNKRDLHITYYETGDISDVPLKNLQNERLSTDRKLKCGLIFKYKDSDSDNTSQIEFNLMNNTFSVSSTEGSDTKYNGTYISPGDDFEDSITSLDKIITNKEKEKVLEVLRHLEPRIQDVVAVNKIIMVDVGLDKMIPINVLGDGIRKLFAIILTMCEVKGGFLLIDEIDNGLYYKSQKTLWRTILKASADLDVQVFASTHSLDSLNALTSVLTEDLQDFQNDVKVYTLRKETDDDISEYRYDYEMFNHLLNQEVEIR